MARTPRVVQILERLARIPTAPLHEEGVAREAASIARAAGARVRVDRFGNLFLTPPKPRGGKPIWLVAHMDHPGLEVVGRREARLLGGIGPQYFRRGLRLRFYHDGEPIAAKVTWTRKRRRPWRAGLAGPEVDRLRRGDFGVFEMPDFRRAGDRVHARQIDDLVGCAVSLAVLERTCPRRRNLRVLLTRAEEVGLVGSSAAAEARSLPKNALVVSVEASRTIPGAEIGGGPVIRAGDRVRTFGPEAEVVLNTARLKLGERPVQRALMVGGVCEATVWAFAGYRSTGVAIPLGNYHNQGPGNRLRPEVVSVRDLATAVDLLELAARHLPVAGRADELTRTRLRRVLRRYEKGLVDSMPHIRKAASRD